MAIQDILTWLIDRHWRDLRIGREPAHAAIDLSACVVEVGGKHTKLSARTIRNMLNGRVRRPTRHSCQVLTALFRPHIPSLDWRWFHAPADEFKALVESRAAAERDPVAGAAETMREPPDAASEANDANDRDSLEGTYLGYRHAFSATTINRITREVLHIYRGNGGLAFRMSYLPGTRGRSDVVMEFRGAVETAGPSVVLIGSTGAGGERRLRTFYARNNGHIEQPELENYKLGLLVSTREGDGVPCAACTLLIKVQRRLEGEEALNAFMRAATRTDTFDKIMSRDFVKGDWVLLRLFLDNRPSRSPKDLNDPTDAALDAWEGPGPRDPVLRISQDRFERSMEEVLQRALSAIDIVPTFREDWRPGTPEEPDADGEEV